MRQENLTVGGTSHTITENFIPKRSPRTASCITLITAWSCYVYSIIIVYYVSFSGLNRASGTNNNCVVLTDALTRTHTYTFSHAHRHRHTHARTLTSSPDYTFDHFSYHTSPHKILALWKRQSWTVSWRERTIYHTPVSRKLSMFSIQEGKHFLLVPTAFHRHSR